MESGSTSRLSMESFRCIIIISMVVIVGAQTIHSVQVQVCNKIYLNFTNEGSFKNPGNSGLRTFLLSSHSYFHSPRSIVKEVGYCKVSNSPTPHRLSGWFVKIIYTTESYVICENHVICLTFRQFHLVSGEAQTLNFSDNTFKMKDCKNVWSFI